MATLREITLSVKHPPKWYVLMCFLIACVGGTNTATRMYLKRTTVTSSEDLV